VTLRNMLTMYFIVFPKFTSIGHFASYLLANELGFLIFKLFKQMKVIYLTPTVQIHCNTNALVGMNNILHTVCVRNK
jgi:hypothetical protein